MILAIGERPYGSHRRFFQIVLLVLVITAPPVLGDWLAIAAEEVAEGTFEKGEDQRGFWNRRAWVGAIEHPLLLGARVGGFPEFIADRNAFEDIATYQLWRTFIRRRTFAARSLAALIASRSLC